MKAHISHRLLALATVTVLAVGCAGTPGTSAIPGNKEGGGGQNRLTLTIVTGEGDPEEARAFANNVAEVSNGAIDIKVDNTTIAGNPTYETDIIKYVAAGKAGLGFAAARAFDTVGVKSFVGFHAPFLIDTYDLEGRVLGSDWGKALLDGTRTAGVVGIGYFQGPMRRPLGMTRPLVKLSDWAGARIGIRESALTAMAVKALGGTPVVFEPGDTAGLDGMEVHMGLLTGTKYDVGANSLTGDVMLWPRPGVIFANSAVFDDLTADQQAILRTAGDRMLRGSVASVRANGPQAVTVLCDRGLKFVQAGASAISELRAAVQPVYDEIEKDAGTKATIDAIEKLRASGSGTSIAADCGDVATATPTPAATTITSPLVGTYRTSFTLDELSKSPLLYDDTELNRDNWGDLTITFGADGRVTFNQSNPSTASSTSGRYTLAGDRVTLAFQEGANLGETFTGKWSLFRDTLTFERIAGGELPTPYVIKAWERQP